MSPTLLVDDREQKPYQFPGVDDVKTVRLPVGDYTYEGFEDQFAVERKTLDDLANSLSNDRLRFENEVRRANGLAHRNKDDNPLPGTKPEYELDHFTVAIEAHPDAVYNYRDKDNCPNYWNSFHPNSFIGTVEKWPQKYDTLKFTWCGTREGAMQETLALLDQWYINAEMGD